MAHKFNYAKKFEGFQDHNLYHKLDFDLQDYIRNIAFNHHFTFQEFREIVEICRDLSIWGERDLKEWWQVQTSKSTLTGAQLKSHLLRNLQAYIKKLRRSPKVYPEAGIPSPKQRNNQSFITEKTNNKIYGMCPVASERTVCCNLRTIDAVENCVYGCSYCSIQTFYSDKFIFDNNFAGKLNTIELEPDRFYHFGTGQSSDSLAWGNRNGILDALCQFASAHPNILLEFKTKSRNIQYFLNQKISDNVVCSWSLNTRVIIDNEEHFTANFQQRIQSARVLADSGIKVAFHIHPMVYYQDWAKDYNKVAATLMARFHPQEVLFVSFGSVTLIKPVIQKIRDLGHPTKTLQMEMVTDPHGKLTYPDKIKIKMFKAIYDSFQPWRNKMFMYLCMEKAAIWEKVFGYVYASNARFESDFALHTMRKIQCLNTDQFTTEHHE